MVIIDCCVVLRGAAWCCIACCYLLLLIGLQVGVRCCRLFVYCMFGCIGMFSVDVGCGKRFVGREVHGCNHLEVWVKDMWDVRCDGAGWVHTGHRKKESQHSSRILAKLYLQVPSLSSLHHRGQLEIYCNNISNTAPLLHYQLLLQWLSTKQEYADLRER